MEVLENEFTVSLTLSGTMDIINIGDFTGEVDRLCRMSGKNIEIDLSQVSYIDSTGVSLLLRLYKHQKQQEKRFDIVKISEKAMSIISLCSLADTIQSN
jgi:anti-anti-sigma factor